MAYLQLKDTLLYYEEFGKGPPVILIHGSLSRGGPTFKRQIPSLQQNYRCICPDLRCHGKSICSRRDWTSQTLSEDIIALMDAMGIQTAHLIGHSMGGDVAMYCAVNSPERIRSIVSIGSAGMVNEEINAYLRRLDPDTIDRKQYRDFLDRMKQDHAEANGGDWEGFFRQTIQNCGMCPNFSDSVLKKLTMPFLLIRGDSDRMVLNHEVERLASLLPNFRCVSVPGGHFAHMKEETADKIIDVLLDFLDGH